MRVHIALACACGVALVVGLVPSIAAQTMKIPPDTGTIHRAAFDGDLKTVKRMLLGDKTLIERQLTRYGTPLHCAAAMGRLDIVRFLLQRHANPNATIAIGDNEPVMMSAAHIYPGQTEARKLAMVKLLIAAGGRANGRDRNGMTVLHRAAFDGSAAIAELLVSKGADVNAKTNGDITPLFFAVNPPPSPASLRLAKCLIAHGADVNARAIGHTVLEHATMAKRTAIAALLRKSGAKETAKGPAPRQR